MSDRPALQLKFWGVRGSTPTPGKAFLKYGGNTSCMEITAGDGSRIIIDAGTGIRSLGREIVGNARDVHLFLTHFHWDHIQGLPFFAPLLTSGHTVYFRSFPHATEIRERLERQMSCPYFTLDFNSTGAQRKFESIDGEMQFGSISVRPFPLNHPQKACGYRIEAGGAAIVIGTDVEHGNAELDKILRQNAEGADLLVYDAQYTPDEYESRKGWGHSTYRAAAEVANDAGVGKLVLFHHDPTHEDMAMDALVKAASQEHADVIAALEGLVLTLSARN